MSVSGEPDLTVLLGRVRAGDAAAADDVVQLAYAELHRLAQGMLAGNRIGVLQPTSLVHEAWIKLNGKFGDVQDRAHFFRLAARAMRQVMIDVARAAKSEKRGGGQTIVTLSASGIAGEHEDYEIGTLVEVLRRLRELNERHADVIELRVMASLGFAEIAELLGVSKSTVHSDFQFARAWLLDELIGEGFDDGPTA
ncbi:MAG: ECF-type sigma factor [Planctomycetota bacterium]